MKAFRLFGSLRSSIVSFTGFVALLLFVAGCAAPERKQSTSRREQLLAVRDDWYKAFNRGDTEEMGRLETQDFLVLSEFGVEARNEQLSGIRKRVAEKKWRRSGSEQVSEDLQVRFHGNCAIVTGYSWTKVPDQKGAPEEKYLLSEVWLESAGSWNVSHLHFHSAARTR